MAWIAVYYTSTGELYSTGTVTDDSVSLAVRGMSTKALGAAPDFTTEAWDPVAHAMVPIPTPFDRVDDFATALGAVWTALTPRVQTAIGAELGALLGSQRFRSRSTPVNLD